jgi:hypothetical protein
MIIGNWIIDNTTAQIVWLKNERLYITKEGLFSSSPSRLYIDSILNICDKDDVTETDFYALNSAIMCAAEIWKINVPKEFSFLELVKKQLEIIVDRQ